MERKSSGAIALILAIMTALSILSGCSSGGEYWCGTWVGERTLTPAEQRLEPHVRGTLQRVKLTVKPDGTFLLIVGGWPFTGDAIFSKNRLTLIPKKLLGRPLESVGGFASDWNKNLEIRRTSGTQAVATLPDEKVTLTKQMQP